MECNTLLVVASYPGLLTPAFVACSTNALVLQATNAGPRRHEASCLSLIETYAVNASCTNTTLGLRLELSLQPEADTHTWCHTHCTDPSHNVLSRRDGWIHEQLKALSVSHNSR